MKYFRVAIIVLMLSICALGAYGYEGGDTGTYKILDYRIMLTPQSDGQATIDYYQKWQVTGGHIPWMTIGTPNDNYTVQSYSADAAGATPANDGGWSGIHLDLKKDYQPGETFEVRLTINQAGLFSHKGTNYRLDFIPGWYDRAHIDSLQVTVNGKTNPADAQPSPTPTSISDESTVWTKTDLSPGEQFPISLTFSDALFPQGIPEESVTSTTNDNSGASDVGIFFGLLVVVFGVIAAIHRFSGDGNYTGGGIHYGGYGGSGCVHSCACACVSCACACACACAGGGGAGCTRKIRHRCSVCDKKKEISRNSVSSLH